MRALFALGLTYSLDWSALSGKRKADDGDSNAAAATAAADGAPKTKKVKTAAAAAGKTTLDSFV